MKVVSRVSLSCHPFGSSLPFLLGDLGVSETVRFLVQALEKIGCGSRVEVSPLL